MNSGTLNTSEVQNRSDSATVSETRAVLARAVEYLPVVARQLVDEAVVFADTAHQGQYRASGEAFIVHPIAVATILAGLHLDPAVVIAGVLHDVPEDTTVTIDELRERFGPEIARLVEGVTKLERIDAMAVGRVTNENPTWAENMRRMLLAMAEDVRVVLIKLADRVHNLETIKALPPARRHRIARESLDVYAPLAARLGMFEMRCRIEDLAFECLCPVQAREIRDLLAADRNNRESYVRNCTDSLRGELARSGISGDVTGRIKNLYSIYRKVTVRNVPFPEIHDIYGLRVIVSTVPEAYLALGVVHQLWRPMAGQFDDYIASPKENFYQSLHTTVVGPGGRALEVQIRTSQMHVNAEYGVAAHWRYKEKSPSVSPPSATAMTDRFEAKIAWLRQLLSRQRELAQSAEEFVDALSADLFRDQVYVFTPKGDVQVLPVEATVLDLAYHIHTNVGHRCIAAKINNRFVPLDTPLKNGDVVEILTGDSTQGPSREWLNPAFGYVKTTYARQRIRQWFRRSGGNLAHGQQILAREISRLGIPAPDIDRLARNLGHESVDQFLSAIGCGDLPVTSVLRKILQDAPGARGDREVSVAGAPITGAGDLPIRLGRCCHPTPPAPIVGWLTRGRLVTVHRTECAHARPRGRAVPLQLAWGTPRRVLTPVVLQIDGYDREGILRDVAATVNQPGIAFSAVTATADEDQHASIKLTIQASDLLALSTLTQRIEAVTGVLRVSRIH